MHIAIITFDGFNELDSLIAYGMLSRIALFDAYLARSGRTTRDAVFFAAFGLFKTAVVAQQIYARFQRGLTKDARFAVFIEGAALLAGRAAETLGSGRL